MKIITIIGARPQFIKASAFSKKVLAQNHIQEILVHTGQHYDENMSTIFFEEMQIPRPHYHLQIGSGNHGSQTGKMMEKIEEIVLTEKPDALLVYGDTNSTLAGALVASKLHVPIAHIEAGLRSFNKKMPEEVNRVLTDHISDWLFVPTKSATKNLLNEGIKNDKIFEVGDIMYDVAKLYANIAEKQSQIIHQLSIEIKSYILVTIHRAENTDNPQRLKNIFESLQILSQKHTIILPLHPRTKKYVQELGISTQNLQIIEPVGYLDMIQLEKNALLILTDSGGVQKEAFFYGVPCVTLRDETEWIELVENNYNALTPPTSVDLICENVAQMLSKPYPIIKNLYGEGNTADKIIDILSK